MDYFVIILKTILTALSFIVITTCFKKFIAEPIFSRIFPKQSYKTFQAVFVILAQLLLYFLICKYIFNIQFISPSFIKSIGIGIGVGVLLICISILINKLLGVYTFRKNVEYFTSNQFSNFITTFVFFLVLALFEEIIFRGIIFTGLRSILSATKSIVIVTIIFVIPHLFNKGINFWSVVSLILGGLFMNLLREISGNIWMPLGFHFAWNFFQGFIGFNVSGGNEMVPCYKVEKHGRELLHGGAFGIEASLITIMVLIVGVVIGLVQSI